MINVLSKCVHVFKELYVYTEILCVGKLNIFAILEFYYKSKFRFFHNHLAVNLLILKRFCHKVSHNSFLYLCLYFACILPTS